jgi:hypothetical protein
MFGLDMMIDSKDKVILLECNIKTGEGQMINIDTVQHAVLEIVQKTFNLPTIKNSVLIELEKVKLLEKDYTFKLDSENQEFNRLLYKGFADRGNWRQGLVGYDEKMSLIFMKGKASKENSHLYYIPVTMKNLIEKDKFKLGSKDDLYINLEKKYPIKDIMMEQHIVDGDIQDIEKYRKYFNNPREDNFWVLKPVAGARGQLISVVRTFEEFKNVHSKIKDIKTFKDRPDFFGPKIHIFVLSKFITNPFLYGENRTGSIRIHLIITNNKTISRAFITTTTAMIKLAKDEFNLNSTEYDRLISHSSRSIEKPVKFDELLHRVLKQEEYNHVLEQIKTISHYLYKMNAVQCYKEADMCFDIFGLDFMITNKLEVKLIEVNASPGIEYPDPKALSDTMFEIFDPVFPPQNKQKITNNLIEVTDL